MRKIACILVFCLLGMARLSSQEVVLSAARYLSGAASDEEIPEDYIHLVENAPRVRVNAAHLTPGLLSDYQIASLSDYRASHGDILSYEELSLVDGFGPEAVAALKPFLSLASSRRAGSTDTVKVRGTALLRGTLSGVGAKVKVLGDSYRAGAAWRAGGGSFYGEYTGRWGRVLAGDFNLRFGQGLLAWTGFSMTSLSTVDAFVLRPAGPSPVWSYTPSAHRGLSYEYAAGHFRTSVFASLSGTIGTHADYLWRRGQLGCTVLLSPTENRSFSIDGRYNLRGTDLAWEGAYRNRSLSGKAAFRFPLGDRLRAALQLRGIPSRFSGKKYGEYGGAAGLSFKSGYNVPVHQLSMTADASLLPVPQQDPRRFQLRIYAGWICQWRPQWTVECRFTERYRNYERPRTAFRADLRYGAGPWLAVFRGEVARCEKIGLLGYGEGGYKGKNWAGYCRLTGFFIPQWNDRIYCYERDAPGTFSVPAYYGRGAVLSLVGNWKRRFGRRFTLRMYGRAGYLIRRDREPVPTLNLQVQAEL